MTAPLKVAVVGAGPAGMYAVGHLLDQRDVPVSIDVFDRLPTPWGLVRAGVAPDHPEKKWVAERLFDFFFDRSNVRFFGNVEIGTDLSVAELNQTYDAVIYSNGANSDRQLGIVGEGLAGSLSAREFVAWYNGHPDYCDFEVDLSQPRAVIIGNGNVALDLARILTLPIEALRKTDIADHALQALSASKVREVVILGRRGWQQAAFNNPELDELLYLPNVDVDLDVDVAADLNSHQTLDWHTRLKQKTLKALAAKPQLEGNKRIQLRFLSSPIELLGDGCVSAVKVQHNQIIESASGSIVQSTSQTEDIHTGLVFRAIGYKSTQLVGLPFDHQKHVIPHSQGRVMGSAGNYVAGWIKRGPQGVIGTNKKCAKETVASLLSDAQQGKLKSAERQAQSIENLLKKDQLQAVNLTQWRAIDRAERLAGLAQERPRVKYTKLSDLLDAAFNLPLEANSKRA